MIKKKVIFIVMITNIFTALVVSAMVESGNITQNIRDFFESLNVSKIVLFLFLFFLWFMLVIIVAYALLRSREKYATPGSSLYSNLLSDKVVQMKEYFHLENVRREEEIFLEVKDYSIRTMAPYMSVDNIEFLCANIESWTKSRGITLKPVNVSDRLSSLDLRHFAWNIGERLGWTGQQRALFIKQSFPKTLQELEVETIRRNLRQKGPSIIKLDIPESGDFHFQ